MTEITRNMAWKNSIPKPIASANKMYSFLKFKIDEIVLYKLAGTGQCACMGWIFFLPFTLKLSAFFQRSVDMLSAWFGEFFFSFYRQLQGKCHKRCKIWKFTYGQGHTSTQRISWSFIRWHQIFKDSAAEKDNMHIFQLCLMPNYNFNNRKLTQSCCGSSFELWNLFTCILDDA